MNDAEMNEENLEDRKFLIFKLANELYAVPLVSIQEIIKMQSIKPVPFMVKYFKGILNLRGSVVSVVDLRLKFEMPCPDGQNELLIVVRTPDGTFAAIVDDVHSVHAFDDSEIEKNLPLRTLIPVQFFKGVARLEERLVNIIDLSLILAADDMAAVKRAG